jgi:RNA polymerase sigma-70 factor, ECF subfamily
MSGVCLVRGVDPGSTASSLVDGLKALQPAAWRQFATVYGPLIYGWARRAGLCGEDAADITQEVFRSVATGAARLQQGRVGDTFRGWLWTITRNKLRDFWRSRSGEVPATGGTDAQELLLLIPENVSGESGAGLAGANGILQRAMAVVRTEFEQRSWDAFWRVTVEGRAVNDVAQELGMTANAIYVNRSRILRRLRELLAGDEFSTSN